MNEEVRQELQLIHDQLKDALSPANIFNGDSMHGVLVVAAIAYGRLDTLLTKTAASSSAPEVHDA